MRLLVTGSRKWPYPDIVEQEMYQVYDMFDWGEELIVVNGRSPGGGADSFAHEWTRRLGEYDERVREDPFFPKYKKWGIPAAYFIRNQEMVNSLGPDDYYLGFCLDNSGGTTDTIKKAKKAGIKGKEIHLTIREDKR